MARVAGIRWAIEAGVQRATVIGLDQYEMRTWQGCYRHITLCLLAHALLAVVRAKATKSERLTS